MSQLKEQLYIHCVTFVKNKETEIRKTIAEAQEAANEETKSSAGDKFETGREVMQQEIDLNLSRLNELNVQKTVLEQIVPAQTNTVIAPGSLVYTTNGNFYIAISAGNFVVDGKKYYAISAASPIGSKLTGHKAGHSFELNDRNVVIERIE